MLFRSSLTTAFALLALHLYPATGLQKSFAPRYPPLRRYNVDPRLVSVSGFSNGAFAVHLTFIYLTIFHGTGVSAGFPYSVASPLLRRPGAPLLPHTVALPDIRQYAAEGTINPVENIRGKRVYAYLRVKDFLVPKLAMFSVVDEYKH